MVFVQCSKLARKKEKKEQKYMDGPLTKGGEKCGCKHSEPFRTIQNHSKPFRKWSSEPALARGLTWATRKDSPEKSRDSDHVWACGESASGGEWENLRFHKKGLLFRFRFQFHPQNDVHLHKTRPEYSPPDTCLWKVVIFSAVLCTQTASIAMVAPPTHMPCSWVALILAHSTNIRQHSILVE